MNLALLSSNANQLRGALLELEMPFRTGLVVLLGLSIILQVLGRCVEQELKLIAVFLLKKIRFLGVICPKQNLNFEEFFSSS